MRYNWDEKLCYTGDKNYNSHTHTHTSKQAPGITLQHDCVVLSSPGLHESSQGSGIAHPEDRLSPHGNPGGNTEPAKGRASSSTCYSLMSVLTSPSWFNYISTLVIHCGDRQQVYGGRQTDRQSADRQRHFPRLPGRHSANPE